MNKEKQIEEMARIIGHCESTLHPDIECHNKATGCYCIENPCHNQRIADKLYNAGYRKQSEGEWIKKDGFLVCSECDATKPIAFSTVLKTTYYKCDYCNRCGAHMKGGAE